MSKYKSLFFKNENLPFVESRIVVDSKHHYDKHFHETLSIGAIEQGEVSYIHEDEQYILKPDQLSIINPNKIHACNPKQNQSRTYHMTYIDKLWCQGIQQNLFGGIDDFLPIDTVQLDDKAMFDSYIKLNYTLLDESIFYLEKEELLQGFLEKLFLKECKKEAQNVKSQTKIEQTLNKAKQYIKENCLENLTTKAISDVVKLSEFYLIKSFKQQFHISPHKYLLNCKINRAKEFLSQGISSAEVAYRVGFFDQSHFSNVFKRYVAATPNEYKASM